MPEALKEMYNQTFFDHLTQAISNVYNSFDSAAFYARIYDAAWSQRELKNRMRHITHTLGALLPSDYRTALHILRDASPALNPYTFETMIFPDFVEVYGQDDWQASLPALEQFTQQSSAEFAVRPFIVQDAPRMMAHMQHWTQHASHHVRRLASEGCRPRLPWAMALPDFKRDPAPILPILEALKHDDSDYVRRSVANNLNDIVKDNPDVVIETLQAWQHHHDDTETGKKIDWITSHALRTLIKQGHPQALQLLGYSPQPAIIVSDVRVEPDDITLGDMVTLSFVIISQADTAQDLIVDYVVHHVRANGQTTPKVFKLRKCILQAGETLTIEKTHGFKPINTRTYYSGQHAMQPKINGQPYDSVTFTLTV